MIRFNCSRRHRAPISSLVVHGVSGRALIGWLILLYQVCSGIEGSRLGKLVVTPFLLSGWFWSSLASKGLLEPCAASWLEASSFRRLDHTGNGVGSVFLALVGLFIDGRWLGYQRFPRRACLRRLRGGRGDRGWDIARVVDTSDGRLKRSRPGLILGFS